jgi:hypothetical protein
VRWNAGRAPAIAHNLLWAILLGAFLFVNLPKTIRDAGREPAQVFQAFHSSDSFLHVTTETTDASERLVSLFESLPSSKTILVVVHYSDAKSQLIAEIVAYLSWPHPVRFVDVADANAASALAGIEPASVAAYVFCGVKPPPWLPSGQRFGSSLAVSVVNRAR